MNSGEHSRHGYRRLLGSFPRVGGLLLFALVLLSGGVTYRPAQASGRTIMDEPPPPPTFCPSQTAGLNQVIDALRQIDISGLADDETSTALFARMAQIISACYDSDVVPQLQGAETSCAMSGQALLTGDTWQRQVTFFNLDSQFLDQKEWVRQASILVHVNCYNEAFDKCVSTHDPSQALVMLTEEKAAVLLGKGDDPDPVDKSKLDRCLTFELDFDSTITTTDGRGERCSASDTVHVQARVPLHKSAATGKLEGQGPLTYLSSVAAASGCQNFFTLDRTNGATFVVTNLTFDQNAASAATSGGAPAEVVTGTINFGIPTETEHFAGSSNGYNAFTRTVYVFHAGFFFGHLADALPPAGASGYSVRAIDYRLSGWTYLGGEVVARRTYDQTTERDVRTTEQESTTIELRHTPQR